MARQCQKCRDMRANGVDVCWLVDPEARTVEVFEGGANGVADGALASPSLPGFALTLAELFSVLD